MIFPPQLKQGDVVGIVAPARKITKGQLEPALETLRAWGLTPLIAKNLFSSGHSYLAGTDRERAEDLQSMVDNDQVKAILSARGGYGSTRIVDDIDFSPLKETPKWLVGFSDVTAFHLRLEKIGVASIHGTMPIFFDRPDSADSVESIRRILFEGTCSITFPADSANRLGTGDGRVIGGNLSLILDSLNTPSEPDTDGKILIVEEVDEYFYKLDRVFTQLRRAGKLDNLAGLIVGHMTDMKNSDLDFGETVQHIVSHAVRDYRYPVAFGFPSGHENPNYAWVHGGVASLNVSLKNADLSYPNIYAANA